MKFTENLRSLFSRYADPRSIKKSTRNETYDEAVERNEVTNSDIQKIYNNYTICFWSTTFFGVLCVVMGLFQLAVGSTMIGISFFSILLICLANMFRFSYRALQIKKKEMVDPKQWLHSYNEWLPLFIGKNTTH